MATNTTNYGFKKPDESDFYDVADQNKNWDLADEALKNLDTPTFEDYTGSTAVPSATDAIDQIKSKGKLGTLLSNIKAAFKGACLIGHIVNNCVTDNAGLPLSAAQGKVLKDLYTQLYSDKVSKSDIEKNGVQIGSSLKVYSYSAGDKTITAIIKAKEKLCHMTGILIVDQNQVMDIYSTGVGSGITVISKTSVVDTPTLTNEKSINIPLVPWSSFIFLCIDSYDISES